MMHVLRGLLQRHLVIGELGSQLQTASGVGSRDWGSSQRVVTDGAPGGANLLHLNDNHFV